MAYFIINQYESYDGVTVSKFASKLYFIQSGVYSDKNNMLDAMGKFSSYIYSTEDNMFYPDYDFIHGCHPWNLNEDFYRINETILLDAIFD